MKLEELKKLAEAATPGKWRVTTMGSSVQVAGPLDELISDNTFNCKGAPNKAMEDAEYIAALPPETIKTLIEVIGEQQKALDRVYDLDPYGFVFSVRESVTEKLGGL